MQAPVFYLIPFAMQWAIGELPWKERTATNFVQFLLLCGIVGFATYLLLAYSWNDASLVAGGATIARLMVGYQLHNLYYEIKYFITDFAPHMMHLPVAVCKSNFPTLKPVATMLQTVIVNTIHHIAAIGASVYCTNRPEYLCLFVVYGGMMEFSTIWLTIKVVLARRRRQHVSMHFEHCMEAINIALFVSTFFACRVCAWWIVLWDNWTLVCGDTTLLCFFAPLTCLQLFWAWQIALKIMRC